MKNRKLGTYGSFYFGDGGRIEFNHCGIEVFRGHERIAIMGWRRFEAAMLLAESQKYPKRKLRIAGKKAA